MKAPFGFQTWLGLLEKVTKSPKSLVFLKPTKSKPLSCWLSVSEDSEKLSEYWFWRISIDLFLSRSLLRVGRLCSRPGLLLLCSAWDLIFSMCLGSFLLEFPGPPCGWGVALTAAPLSSCSSPAERGNTFHFFSWESSSGEAPQWFKLGLVNYAQIICKVKFYSFPLAASPGETVNIYSSNFKDAITSQLKSILTWTAFTLTLEHWEPDRSSGQVKIAFVWCHKLKQCQNLLTHPTFLSAQKPGNKIGENTDQIKMRSWEAFQKPAYVWPWPDQSLSKLKEWPRFFFFV